MFNAVGRELTWMNYCNLPQRRSFMKKRLGCVYNHITSVLKIFCSSYGIELSLMTYTPNRYIVCIKIFWENALHSTLGEKKIVLLYDDDHHHIVSPARISLTFSRHYSLSFIASDRSSGLHPVSSHSCCMYVRAGRPAFAQSYVGVHKSTSLMSSSLLLQQCPAYLVRLTWIVFVMGGRWPYS